MKARARAADGLDGVRVIDRDRQRPGGNVVHKAVRVVEAMWRSVAIRARLSKRKEKSSVRALGRSSVEALGLRF